MSIEVHIELNEEFLRRYPEFEEEFSLFTHEENKIADNNYIPDDIPQWEWNSWDSDERWEFKEKLVNKLEGEFLKMAKKNLLPKIEHRFMKMTSEQLKEHRKYIIERNELHGWLFWQPVMMWLLDMVWEAYLTAKNRERARKAGLVNAKKNKGKLKKQAKEAARKRWAKRKE